MSTIASSNTKIALNSNLRYLHLLTIRKQESVTLSEINTNSRNKATTKQFQKISKISTTPMSLTTKADQSMPKWDQKSSVHTKWIWTNSRYSWKMKVRTHWRRKRKRGWLMRFYFLLLQKPFWRLRITWEIRGWKMIKFWLTATPRVWEKMFLQ